MTMEAETGVIQLHDKEAKDLRATRSEEEVRKYFLLKHSEGAWPYWHLDFRLLASRTVRK